MLEAAGPLHVEISKDGPTFYGDGRFGEEAKMTSRGFAQLVEEELLIRQSAPKVEEERHLYLNQCPLYPPPSSSAAPSLLDDIRLPSFLLPCLRPSSSSTSSSCTTSSIPFPSPAEAPSLLPALHSANLWVSAGGTSSNVHYDCFPNLLCVVHGSKRVALWPPAATPHLRPHPVYGKATNHSRLNVHEDGTVEGAESLPRPMVAVVRPGQMLFIPEGWYHQVTSPAPRQDQTGGEVGTTMGAPAEDDYPLRLVVAVNIWWKSEFDLLLEASSRRPTTQSENGDDDDDLGMEIYYARRLMEILTRKEMQRMMNAASDDLDDDLDTNIGWKWCKRKRAGGEEEEDRRKKAKKDEDSNDDVVVDHKGQAEETTREEVAPGTDTLAELLRRLPAAGAGSDPGRRAALVGEMARWLLDSAQCSDQGADSQQQRRRRDLRAWLRACDEPMMMDCLEAAMDSSPPALAAFLRSLSVVDTRLLLERLQQDDRNNNNNNNDDDDDDVEGTRRERWWLRFVEVMRPHGSLAELLRKEQSLHELAFGRAIAHTLAT